MSATTTTTMIMTTNPKAPLLRSFPQSESQSRSSTSGRSPMLFSGVLHLSSNYNHNDRNRSHDEEKEDTALLLRDKNIRGVRRVGGGGGEIGTETLLLPTPYRIDKSNPYRDLYEYTTTSLSSSLTAGREKYEDSEEDEEYIENLETPDTCILFRPDFKLSPHNHDPHHQYYISTPTSEKQPSNHNTASSITTTTRTRTPSSPPCYIPLPNSHALPHFRPPRFSQRLRSIVAQRRRPLSISMDAVHRPAPKKQNRKQQPQWLVLGSEESTLVGSMEDEERGGEEEEKGEGDERGAVEKWVEGWDPRLLLAMGVALVMGVVVVGAWWVVME